MPSRSRLRRPERIAQQKLVALVRHFYPDLLFWHTPNGEDREPKVAVVLKAMGVEPGVPDLFFPTLRLFVEMKAPGQRMSESQARVREKLLLAGYIVRVYDDHEQAFAFIEGFMRERTPDGLPR